MPKRFSPVPLNLYVKRSAIGRGLFSGERIAKGTCVIEYLGKPATEQQILLDKGKYLFIAGRGSVIDGNVAGNKARFINHSCKPNCEIDIYRKRVYVFAKRLIKEGEELTYDYGDEYFEAHIKPFGCKCEKCNR